MTKHGGIHLVFHAQRLSALTEDPSFTPTTRMGSQPSLTPLPHDPTLSSDSMATRHTVGTDM